IGPNRKLVYDEPPTQETNGGIAAIDHMVWMSRPLCAPLPAAGQQPLPVSGAHGWHLLSFVGHRWYDRGRLGFETVTGLTGRPRTRRLTPRPRPGSRPPCGAARSA